MGKIKLTKGELKRQRDALRQYERYLPTLQLKKQQLQIEITRQVAGLEEKTREEQAKSKAVQAWSEVFCDQAIEVGSLLSLDAVLRTKRNVAGVDIEIFGSAEFHIQDYDLFLMPPWVDTALEALKVLIALQAEIALIRKGIATLLRELRITTQRVNLFEKVKIPEAQEAIRLIKIYIGDQMANAVGRSKIAKRKIEEAVFEEASFVA